MFLQDRGREQYAGDERSCRRQATYVNEDDHEQSCLSKLTFVQRNRAEYSLQRRIPDADVQQAEAVEGHATVEVVVLGFPLPRLEYPLAASSRTDRLVVVLIAGVRVELVEAIECERRERRGEVELAVKRRGEDAP